MTRSLPPICHYCSRLFEKDDDKRDAPAFACEAFPDGIPDAIWLRSYDHRLPYPGDNGIRFAGHVPDFAEGDFADEVT